VLHQSVRVNPRRRDALQPADRDRIALDHLADAAQNGLFPGARTAQAGTQAGHHKRFAFGQPVGDVHGERRYVTECAQSETPAFDPAQEIIRQWPPEWKTRTCILLVAEARKQRRIKKAPRQLSRSRAMNRSRRIRRGRVAFDGFTQGRAQGLLDGLTASADL